MASENILSEPGILEALSRDLVDGSHMMHYHHVLDAFGHISFRHPYRANIFVMSRSIAPATITSTKDLIEYFVDDAEPVDPSAPAGFLERHIHSECYKHYPGVQSILHSHSESVVPYSFNGVALQACCHVAGFLGTQTPVWDIADTQFSDAADKIDDMLVRSTRTGRSLALAFADGDPFASSPKHAVVLLRGHGFTVLGESLKECVVRAYYTQKNAAIQTQALMIRAAQPSAVREFRCLSEREARATAKTIAATVDRPWGLWKREINACGLYSNLT